MILVDKNNPTNQLNLGCAFLSFDPKVNFKTPKPFMETNQNHRRETLNHYTMKFGFDSKNMRLIKAATTFNRYLFEDDLEYDYSSLGVNEYDYIWRKYTTNKEDREYEKGDFYNNTAHDVNLFEAVREEYLNRKSEQIQQADLNEMEEYTDLAEKNSKKSILQKLLGDKS